MSDMDRRAFVGAAALGTVAATVLTSSSAEAAGDNSGYFVIAEITSTKEKADELAKKIRGALEPRGRWVQYSYHIVKDRSRGGEHFHLISSQVVWLNLPPARVSVYQK